MSVIIKVDNNYGKMGMFRIEALSRTNRTAPKHGITHVPGQLAKLYVFGLARRTVTVCGAIR
ncbi:MAG: hypothetical protein LBT55_05415 [Clostridiaceae bacterium]|jgi:hypothetical protein|nr:hypothetical protein [Clostridiaceae bacterium]